MVCNKPCSFSDTNANMTSNSTDIVVGDDVTISNSVSYRGPSIQSQQPPLPPQFYWTSQSDSNQNITSYQGSPTHTSASSYIIVKANPPYVGPYSCNLFFNPPTFLPTGCADNNPIYSKSWESPTQSVSCEYLQIALTLYTQSFHQFHLHFNFITNLALT